MTWGNAPGSRSADRASRTAHLTRLRPIPFGALIGVMAVTVILWVNCLSDLADQQARFDEAARQEFSLEMTSATPYTSSEIDRLRELLAGITAFTEVSGHRAEIAVVPYLDLTGTPDRFAGFVDARVLGPEPTRAGDAPKSLQASKLFVQESLNR